MRTSNQELISIVRHTQNRGRGIDMLKNLNGPLSGVKFCPVGGISADNFIDFLASLNVVYAGDLWTYPENPGRNENRKQIS